MAATQADGDAVADRSRAVRPPDHDQRERDSTHYVPVEWVGAERHFEVSGQRWVFDARTGDATPED